MISSPPSCPHRPWTAAALGLAFVLLGVTLGACGEAPPEIVPDDAVDLLSPTERLTRASMALRGVRPAPEELRAVAEDPTWYPSLVEFYLSTPEFGDTVRELHAEALRLNVDSFSPYFGYNPLDELAEVPFDDLNRSLARSPLELIAYVVQRDRPYTEIVTADYVFANEAVAAVWGLPYDASGGGWQPTQHVDGRAMAGILSDNAVFQRHGTTPFNMNRGRANAVASALLCYDFLDRQVEVDTNIDLSNEAAVLDAINNREACKNCHQTLDPLAAFFAVYNDGTPSQVVVRYPVENRLFNPEGFLDRRPASPAYFGTPGQTIADLGRSIADAPRFGLCAARRFAGHLLRVPADSVPRAVVERFYRTFRDEGMSAKALARAVVLSREFRVAGSDREDDAWLEGIHLARPSQLARSLEALTGYRMEVDVDLFFPNPYFAYGTFDMMDDSVLGFEVLAGGTDSVQVTSPARTMTATSTLVRRSLAGRAAIFVVIRDLTEPDRSARRLLTRVEANDTDEALVRAQLADLYLAIYGDVLEPEDPALDDAYALFDGLAASGDVPKAWVVTLYALFSDLRFATY
ncbi:MAG: hypothetical protein ACFCGT_00120 [Sandaracinaceae bacterium]